MKHILYILSAAILLAGCGRSGNISNTLDSLMSETSAKAETDKGIPSETVDVRLYYTENGEIISETCKGFIMDTHNPLGKNVGVILGTTNGELLKTSFIASFPTVGPKAFTCIVRPKNMNIFDHVEKNDTDYYIITTSALEEQRPEISRDGQYETNIMAYLYVLSLTETVE